MKCFVNPAAVAVAAAIVTAALAGRAAAQSPCLFAVTTDFSVAGSTAKLALGSPWAAQTGIETVGSDPQVRAYGDRIYVVNRYGSDNIQVLDPAHNFDTVREISVGAGTNPQDIAFVSTTKAYVSRYDAATILIINPSTGGTLGTINLAPFADADGLPEMAQMAIDGGRLFVAVQRWDRSTWTLAGASYLVVINTTTDAIIDVNPSLPGTQAITLAGPNPNQELQLDAATHRIYVGEMGNYGVNDGGIEVINATTMASLGWLTTETQLGGDLGPFAVASSKGYAMTSSDAFFTGQLARFAIPGGARTGTLYTTTGYVPDVELDATTSQLFLADRLISAPGVHVFSTSSDTRLTASPVSTGLPPFDLVVFRPVATDVAADAGGLLVRAEPSPFVEATRFRLLAAAAGEEVVASSTGALRIEIFDTAGRRVRRIEGAAVAGVEWDGRDDAGRVAAPGVYHYRASREGILATGRVVRVR